MAEYRGTGDAKYALNNSRLIPWLKQNVSPYQWVIELTGGEPSLYPGIADLCEWLSISGYTVLVKTNGSLPIPAFKNVKRVAAFHKLEDPPRHYDEILIIDGLQSSEKAVYCDARGIKYHIIGFNNENPDNSTHGFRLCAFMDPHGHPVACKNRPVRFTEWPDKYALEYVGLNTTVCCSFCKAAIDAWRFLDF